MSSPFADQNPNISSNSLIREPQKEAYAALQNHKNSGDSQIREVGIVLPVGCGKSGTITITPFAFKSKRTLVVAPNLPITEQLYNDFNPTNSSMFYRKCGVLTSTPYPEPVEIRGTTTNRGDLDDSHVVITNIQQLQGGQSNRWLQNLPNDYFDLILFDEGHHSVADSYDMLKKHFPEANIVNFSATPQRSDGQIMSGRVIYSYPIVRAIQAGYVKRLKAVQLNPRTLKYVRNEDGQEVEVGLEEVRRLGEEDADFRRSIVTSKETLTTIVDASIRELQRLRKETNENRLKIIASALNFAHCSQVVEAYKARGLKADYVHSRLDGDANKKVMGKLENHDLDVIVQVRKLGEGFDHPYLSVAAVFSIFSNLSPFVQFVGRIMRVIEQNNPNSVLNQGIVVFHAGANIARQWSDFQTYSDADQAFFDQLLPLEGLDPTDTANEHEIVPNLERIEPSVTVVGQSNIEMERIPLNENLEALDLLRKLQKMGYNKEQVSEAYDTLEPLPTTKVAERQAMRSSLDMKVKTEAARILNARGISSAGRELDHARLNRDNLIVVKAAIDKKINALVGQNSGERSEFTRAQLNEIDIKFTSIISEVEREIFDAK